MSKPSDMGELLGLVSTAVNDGRIKDLLVLARMNDGTLCAADNNLTISEARDLFVDSARDFERMVHRWAILRRRCHPRRRR